MQDVPKLDYKIETKPSWWVVSLEHGCYSDRDIQHYYFHANSEEEVWNFLCRYADSKPNGYSDYFPCLVWGDKKHQPSWYDPEVKWYKLNWNTSYGDAQKVTMTRLQVIEFQK